MGKPSGGGMEWQVATGSSSSHLLACLEPVWRARIA